MATKTFRGDAAGLAEVQTIAIGGTWATSDTVSLTMNGKTLTVTIGSDTATTDVVAALVAAWNGAAAVNDESRNITGNLVPEMDEITASADGSNLVLTHDETGVPFTVTVGKSSSSGTIGSPSVTVAAKGGSLLSADNVSGGSLPTTGDTFVFEDSSVDLLYDLDAITDTLAKLNIKASYTASIGLPRFNVNSYAEYRPREFAIEATEVVIGDGEGDGSPRILLNLGAVQSSVLVLKTAESADDGYHALRLRGTHASNVLRVEGSSTVDVAVEAGQIATFATLIAGGSSRVRTGDGVTLTTVIASGSAVIEIHSLAALDNITTITIRDNATVIVYGTNDITTVEILGSGTFDDRGSGTITTVQKGPNAHYTTENSSVAAGARTITNTQLSPGRGRFADPAKRCVFSNAIDLGLGGLSDFPGLNLGSEIDLQRS